jgi:hypothetical protein
VPQQPRTAVPERLRGSTQRVPSRNFAAGYRPAARQRPVRMTHGDPLSCTPEPTPRRRARRAECRRIASPGDHKRVPWRYPLVLYSLYHGTEPAPSEDSAASSARSAHRRDSSAITSTRPSARRRSARASAGWCPRGWSERVSALHTRTTVRRACGSPIPNSSRGPPGARAGVPCFALGTRRSVPVESSQVPTGERSHAPECTPWRHGPPSFARTWCCALPHIACDAPDGPNGLRHLAGRCTA